jgi:maltose/moltooligosaccharide transporter
MKLNYKRTFFIGLAFMSICTFWQLYDNIVPLILKNTFDLNEFITGCIMALDNVLALFLLPFFGALSDKVNTKIGKRTPFILFGTIISVIFMLLLPIADQQNNFILFFISLGIVLIAMGSYRSPAVALMPDITPKPLRSRANSIINLMGTLGAIFTLLVTSLLIPKTAHPNYTMVFIAVAAFMITATAIFIFTIRENDFILENKQQNTSTTNFDSNGNDINDINVLSKDMKKSLNYLLASVFLWFTAYNAVSSAYSRYAVKVWGLDGGSFANPLLVATAVATISYVPIGFLSGKIGRKKTIIIGIIMMTLAYSTAFLFTEYTPFIFVVFSITGMGWAAINVNSYPMVVEMSSGSDVGKYTGIYYTFSMSAQIITPILSAILLQNISYRTLFPYSVVFSVLSLCTMILVKHGDINPSIKSSALDLYDSE